jgi:NADP-dependent 3-hydroxy acid dehydrogenase YdfG
MKYFRDKVIIVTGASSGIGEVVAIRLSELGAKVVLAARNEHKLGELQYRIESSGNEAISVKTDISIESNVINLVDKTFEKWGRIDILISNAGQHVQGSLSNINTSDFKNSFDVNFYGSVYTVKKVLPIMISQKSGHIVFVNSLDSKKGIVGDGPYVAAKCALHGFGDVLRQEVKELGIKVSTVYPGRVDTPMIEDLKVPLVSAKITSDKVVKSMIKGIRKNKAIIVVPKMFFLLGTLNELAPKIMDWFYKKFKLEGEKK